MPHEQESRLKSLFVEVSPGKLADLIIPLDNAGIFELNFEIQHPKGGLCLGFTHEGNQDIHKASTWKFDHINIWEGTEIYGDEPQQMSFSELKAYLEKEGFGGEEAIEQLVHIALQQAQEVSKTT